MYTPHGDDNRVSTHPPPSVTIGRIKRYQDMSDRRQFLAGFLGLFAAAAVAFPSVTHAAGREEQAKRFIESLAGRALETLFHADLPRDQRIREFRALFNEAFAVKSTGRWILGRYWNQATDAERVEYLRLFEDLMIVTYVDRFTDYSGENLKVVDALVDDETYVTVRTEVGSGGSSKAYKVDWRIGQVGNRLKIADVVVEGTSLSATFRSDFASTIRRNGGSVSGLIEELRAKTKSLANPS